MVVELSYLEDLPDKLVAEKLVDRNGGSGSTNVSAGVVVFPLDGPGSPVVGTDVAHELAGQVGSRFEDAPGDYVAFDFVEPELDLIQPTGVGRRVVQTDIGMVGEEVIDALGLMRRKVIDDHVDLALGRLSGDQSGQEGDELFAGVVGGGLTDDLAGASIERGIERKAAFADVLESMALGSTGRERQDGQRAIQRLDGAFLVHAEYDRVLGRVQVKANDIERLALEVGIVGSHVALQTLRLEARPRPGPSHLHVVDAQLASEPARAPVGSAVSRRLHRQLQDPGLQAHRRGSPPTAAVASVDALQAGLVKAPLPARDVLPVAFQPSPYVVIGTAIGKQKNESRSADVGNPQIVRAEAPFELRSFILGQDDGVV